MYLGLEIKDLVLVRAIARSGGVSQAARSLHLSQSAVSHHLARLEARLGVPLFDRVGRSLSIAASGLRIVGLADEIVPRLAAVAAELREPTHQVLRFATQCYTAYHWLPRVTASLSRQHPHVELRICLEATRDPFGALDRGALDLALVHTLPKNSRGYKRPTLARDELLLVMAPGHPLAASKRVTPAQLQPHRFFVFDSTGPELLAQRRMTFPDGGAPERVQRIPVTEALIQLVCSGQGVSLMSRWTIGPHLERGELVSRPLLGAQLERTWRAAYRRDSALRDPIETVVATLRDAG
jgi:LysR family transcriptional regulator, regulator for metE and metH